MHLKASCSPIVNNAPDRKTFTNTTMDVYQRRQHDLSWREIILRRSPWAPIGLHRTLSSIDSRQSATFEKFIRCVGFDLISDYVAVYCAEVNHGDLRGEAVDFKASGDVNGERENLRRDG